MLMVLTILMTSFPWLSRACGYRSVPARYDTRPDDSNAKGKRAEFHGLVPDAVQRAAHQGVYARRRGLCGAVLRWSGTVPNAGVWNGPGSAAHHYQRVYARLRRAMEVLRCARDKYGATLMPGAGLAEMLAAVHADALAGHD